MKASAFISDALLDPATGHSEEPSDAPCLRLFKTKNYFEYIHSPGNEYLNARFQAAMSSVAISERSTILPGGFPWESLARGTKIVDVGGGIGGACQEIMKENPFLKFTVQDLPNVANEAIEVSGLTPASILLERAHKELTVLESSRAQGDRRWAGYDPRA